MPPSPTPELTSGAFPTPALLPGPRGFSHQGIFWVIRRPGELGTVGRECTGFGLGTAGAKATTEPSVLSFVQLDREHRVAGIFPCPTFKDKSTYIESSTKVYDDVSVPAGRGWSPSTRTAEPSASQLLSPRFGACHTLCPLPAKSRVPRAPWKFPRPSLPGQVWVGEGRS